jgi:hypothetical protein
MMSGTTMGEIKIPIMVVLYGNSGRLKPSAARVPRKVDINVEKKAITSEFLTAACQVLLVKNFSYHCVEYPAGSSDSISGVKVK